MHGLTDRRVLANATDGQRLGRAERTIRVSLHCHVEQLPFNGVESTVFFCSERESEPAQPCKFCGEPADHLCDWRVLKPIRIAVTELQVGHALYPSGPGGPGPFGVTEIRMEKRSFGKQLRDILTVHVDFKGHLWRYKYWPEEDVYCMGPGTCDTPCCELHLRSVDEDRDYCMSHWKAWEEIKV